MSKKTFLVKAQNCKLIPWQELKGYEFNDLKAEDRDVAKLKNAIVNNGFCFPFFTWSEHRYVIDGNGRNLALTELEKEGYTIPDLPIVEIQASSKREAKKLVLQASSEHGKITELSFSDFTADIDFTPFELNEFNLHIDAESMNNYLNLDTDDQDLINADKPRNEINNDYIVVIRLTESLKSKLDKVKKKEELIIKILEKHLD